MLTSLARIEGQLIERRRRTEEHMALDVQALGSHVSRVLIG